MSQHPSRRNFLRTAASAAATPLLCAADTPRPNILWLTWEDIGPHLHCFGDDYSTTPNFDRLAKRGCVYPNTWASAPVCAPPVLPSSLASRPPPLAPSTCAP